MPAAPRFSAPEIWESAKGQLVLKVTRQNYENWLRDARGHRFEGMTLVIRTPTDLARDWLATRMRPLISQAVCAVAGPGLVLAFETEPQAANASAPDSEPRQRAIIPEPAPQANPRLTFGSLLPGEFNKMALLAAEDVVSARPSPYSPLFITGPGGSGKTHLLHAIANRAEAEGITFLLVTADQFVSDFTTAVRGRTGAAFRARYRDIELLLIDDAHVLVGKKASLTEFYRTIASLHDQGKSVVVAGDHSALICDTAGRFDTPLHWGLVASISHPEIGDRISFIEGKVRCQSIRIGSEVIHYIALRVKTNLRELEGAINRVLAHARISAEPMNIDLAARALQPVSPVPLRSLPAAQPSEVIQAVCNHLSTTPAVIQSERRDREATYARHLTMYVLRKDSRLTYSGIATILNKKDHSTVVHACTMVERQLPLSPPLRADIDAVRAALRHPSTAA